MKRILALILAALMLAATLTLVSCGDKKEEPIQDDPKDPSPRTDVDVAQLAADIAAAFGDKYMLTYPREDGTDGCDISAEDIALYDHFDLTQVDAYVAKQAAVTAIHKDAMFLLKCKDGYADTAVAKFNEAFAGTYSYRGYASSYEIMKTEYARLYKIGNYVLYIVTGSETDGSLSDDEAAAAIQKDYDNIDAVIKAAFNVETLENLIVKPEIDDSQSQGGGMGGLGGLGGFGGLGGVGGLVIPDIDPEGDVEDGTDAE